MVIRYAWCVFEACGGTPDPCTNSISKRNCLFLGWLNSRLHNLVGYRAFADWKSKSINNLMLPIQITTPYCPCHSRREQLIAAFLD